MEQWLEEFMKLSDVLDELEKKNDDWEELPGMLPEQPQDLELCALRRAEQATQELVNDQQD